MSSPQPSPTSRTRPDLLLVRPSAALRDSWWASAEEMGGPDDWHGYGLFATTREEITTDAGFTAWLDEQDDSAHTAAPGRIPWTLWWIVEAADPETVLGSIDLRHHIDHDFLGEYGGHIGYGVRPSARGRGVATEALRLVLDQARDLGLERVLITCEDDNPASAAVIERVGGRFERMADTKRRYWVTLSESE